MLEGPLNGSDAFAAVVARLRLKQGEIQRLLALPSAPPAAGILPDGRFDGDRVAVLTDALGEALSLVEDDALLARWLRSPLPRRGGASPLEEAERSDDERLIRFVLRPHPAELVRLIADGEVARLRHLAEGRTRRRARV